MRARWLVAIALAGSGCELREMTIVDVEDVVVAEVYVEIGGASFSDSKAFAFLHRTVGGLGEGFHPVPGASIALTRSGGSVLELGVADLEICASALPEDGTGSCYWLPPAVASLLRPGEGLRLDIGLPEGGTLASATTVPAQFTLLGIAEGERCKLPADTPMELRWTRAEGAWAYINETLIEGLRAALEPRGSEVESDSLELLGLSVSAQDTTINFPTEFGIFDRFELDQDLATALQDGLPAGTRARVTISAADRNYVNWVRGGNFNPSGQVRVPSLVGDGTGAFAATVTRAFEVFVDPDSTGQPYDLPVCPLS